MRHELVVLDAAGGRDCDYGGMDDRRETKPELEPSMGQRSRQRSRVGPFWHSGNQTRLGRRRGQAAAG